MTYRYFGAFRLLLAALVVFHHYGCNLASGIIRETASTWVPGTSAVLVFFALSGFVLAESASTIYLGRPQAFILNRATRIVPPYWIALCLVLVLVLALSISVDPSGKPMPSQAWTAGNILANFLFLWPDRLWPTTYSIRYDFLVVFWSVRYEIVFYFALLIALAVARGSSRRLFWILIVGAILVTTYSALSRIGATHPGSGFRTALWPFFAVGVLAMYVERTGWILAPFVLLTMLVAVSGYPFITSNVNADWTLQIGLTTILLLLAGFLSQVRGLVFRKVDIFLGDLSYSLYLTHIPIQLVALNFGLAPSTLCFGLCFVASLVVAVAFDLAVEPSIARVRDRIRGERIQNLVSQGGYEPTSPSSASEKVFAEAR